MPWRDVIVDPEGEIPPEQRVVYVLYARAMLSVQLLEITIFQLAQMERKSPKDIDRALRQVAGLLMQPKADQVKDAGLNIELIDDVQLGLRIRNRLAHDFLALYHLELAVDKEVAQTATAFLTATTAFIDDVLRRLDEVADNRLMQRRAHPTLLDDEELDEIIQSVKRWAHGETGDSLRSTEPAS